MSTAPKSPSQMLRSLGADDSALDAKLKASAREAELRWPLFRALAPAPSELPPALTDNEKRAWEQPESTRPNTRKPSLTRPGLSNKLASSLEKLTKATKPAAPLRRSMESAVQPIAAPKIERAGDAARARPTHAAATNFAQERSQPASTPPFTPPQPTRNASALFAGKLTAQPTVEPTATPSGLFAARKPAHPEVKTSPQRTANNPSPLGTPARSLASATGHAQSAETLAALFDRVEGKEESPAQKTTSKASSSIMRRIGKR